MNLSDTMNRLGQYARNGLSRAGSAFIKPIILSIATVVLAAIFSTVEAQTHADTLTGQGSVLVIDNFTGNPIQGANVYFHPDSVEMTLPNINFQFSTDGVGIANYDVITGIDTTVGINDFEEQSSQMQMFPNPGPGTNLFFNDFEKGNINVYNVEGKLVSQNVFSGNQFQVDLSNFTNGVYFINVQTEDGDVYNKKFIKNNSLSTGQASRPDFKSIPQSSAKMANNFTALYDVLASANGYESDSLEMYISQGSNGQFQMNLTPLPSSIDTLWGSGLIGVLNSSNNQQISYVDLTFTPDTVPLITPDTSWNFQSYPGPAYTVPVHISSQLPTSSTATYRVQANETGFYPLDTLLTFANGTNANKFVNLHPLPPAVVNIEFNVAEISGAPISNVLSDSAFVYIKDMQGNKDSAWTVNGVATFFDVGQNTQYVWGAGKNNMWGWNGASITTPTGSLGDTLTFKIGADLVPDSVYSRKSGSMVIVDPAFLIDLHAYYNVQIGRMDTLRFHLSSSYSQSQVDSATAWIANYGAWTGINTKIENNSFAIPPSNFPIDTGDVSVLGVNITPGTSNCNAWVWSYNNYYVSLGANMTNMFTTQAKLHKEIGRINFDEAANSFMSPVSNNMSARDAAHADILYRLDEAYFNGLHSLPNFQYFISSSTFVPQ